MQPPLNGVQDQLDQHKHAVEEQGGVAEVQLKDLGNAVGNRNDGGNAQTGLGVQGQTQGQDQKPQNIKENAVKTLLVQ